MKALIDALVEQMHQLKDNEEESYRGMAAGPKSVSQGLASREVISQLESAAANLVTAADELNGAMKSD